MKLSIEEAVARAEGTSEAVAVARAEATRARGEALIAGSTRWPRLDAFGSYERTLISELAGLLSGADLPEELTALPFGREHTYRAGLSVSYDLYAGGRSGAAEDLAGAGTRIAALGVSSARAAAPLTVVEAYYDAQLSEQLLATAEGALALAEWTLDQVEHGRAEQLVAEFELLRARVARDNRRPAVVQRRVDRELAFLRLKQLLDLPGDTRLELTSPLGEAGPIPARLPAAEEAGPRRRAPVQQAALAIEAGEAGVELAASRHLPTVALGTTYGVVAYPNSSLPSSADFNDGWTASVTVALPLFTGGAIRGGVIEAEAAVSASRARLRQIEEAARLDEARSRAALGAARATLEASVSTVEEARRARELAELRYREGLSTQLELSDATLLLSEAQVNRARAARDFQVARLRLELLPLLPLPGVEVTAPTLRAGAAAGPDAAASPGAAGGTGAGTAGSPSATTPASGLGAVLGGP